jgi:hypothetical protein
MKKMLVMLSALIVLSSSALADEDWGLACSKEEIGNLNFGNVLISSSSVASVAGSIIDTAHVDYKNKVIKTWVLYVMTPQGRQSNIDNLGTQYNNYGYTKMLKVINLKNNTSEIMSYANYNCDGSLIVSNSSRLGRDALIPGSIDDLMVKDLRKKFKI